MHKKGKSAREGFEAVGAAELLHSLILVALFVEVTGHTGSIYTYLEGVLCGTIVWG